MERATLQGAGELPIDFGQPIEGTEGSNLLSPFSSESRGSRREVAALSWQRGSGMSFFGRVDPYQFGARETLSYYVSEWFSAGRRVVLGGTWLCRFFVRI